MNNLWINYNGAFFPELAPVLPASNRSFRYGDGIFESMRMLDEKIPWLCKHAERLRKGMELLRFDEFKEFTDDFIKAKIIELAEKNGLKNARIRLSIYRDATGLYTPKSNKAGFIIEMNPLENNQYQLNEKGLSVDVFSEALVYPNAYTCVKTANSLVYVLAGVYKKKQNLDDCLLLNTTGNLCDSIGSNIFLVITQNDLQTIWTPPISEGCVDGVMRSIVFEIATQKGIAIEEGILQETDLLHAEEVFTSNAIEGLHWIGSYKANKYEKKVVATELVAELNKCILSA